MFFIRFMNGLSEFLEGVRTIFADDAKLLSETDGVKDLKDELCFLS